MSGHYENLTTRKSTSRGILAGILTKTSETCKLTPKYMLETKLEQAKGIFKSKLLSVFKRYLTTENTKWNLMCIVLVHL